MSGRGTWLGQRRGRATHVLVDPERGRVKPHFVIDASLDVRLKRVRAADVRLVVAGRNLTNERFAFNFGNPFSGTHFGARRTWSVGLLLRPE